MLATAFVGQEIEEAVMEPVATEVLREYYGGELPAEPFRATRDPALEHGGRHLAIATTHRFLPEDQAELIASLESHLVMTNMQFGSSRYNLHGMVPTGFVTKDEVAQHAAELLPLYVG